MHSTCTRGNKDHAYNAQIKIVLEVHVFSHSTCSYMCLQCMCCLIFDAQNMKSTNASAYVTVGFLEYS